MKTLQASLLALALAASFAAHARSPKRHAAVLTQPAVVLSSAPIPTCPYVYCPGKLTKPTLW